jgi:hypothetical protein
MSPPWLSRGVLMRRPPETITPAEPPARFMVVRAEIDE